MFLRLLYDEKLAQASYLIGCETSGEALVVDPNRAVDRYLDMARREGLRVTHVTETHIHADFVSGSRELARRAGAQLYLSSAGGPSWQYRFARESGAVLLEDGSRFRVGAIELSVLHTPGHTPEHLTFLVADTRVGSMPMGALTGDFIFVGDVGRPDLLERAANEKGTMDASARQLFASLRRFRELPDYLQIWPGHGAGSSCGKSLGAVPQSTLGYEKQTNWAFAMENEDEFVRTVLEGQPDPPRYFAFMKRINRDGPPLRNGAVRPERLPPARLASVLAAGASVVDARSAQEYARGSVPGTINIPYNRSFTNWAGWLVPYDRDFYLIGSDETPAQVDGIASDLAGIGLDRFVGYFDGPTLIADRNDAPLQTIPTVDGETVQKSGASGVVNILDVRTPAEWREGHLPWARHVPLGALPDRIEEIPRDRPIIVHCQAGGRAAIAASLLLARGFPEVSVFSGGFAEWKTAGRAMSHEPV
jgi:hydroxyacylglutathione hydrolase